MDIHAGAGLCLGPRNLIGEIAKFPRVAVTLQGANIMTRSQVAFGQGIIRCHPCLRDEIMAAGLRGRAALVAFDKAFARHLRLALSHALRSLLLGLTGARLAAAPRGSRPNGRYYRQLSRLAAAFGITPLVIGLTVVAFGTSAPEMVVKDPEQIEVKAGARRDIREVEPAVGITSPEVSRTELPDQLASVEVVSPVMKASPAGSTAMP